MLIYILKCSVCLAIFMVFYKLLLETSSVHKFKRFYLLGALILALVIPSLTFIEYIVVEEFTSFVVPNFDLIETSSLIVEVDYTPIILWSIYGFGVLTFLLKFCRNLNHIISRIQGNPKLKSEGFINVLVSNLKIPHTFFSYIFFNKDKFEHNSIPREVLVHEQAHARQKHSIDIIFLEVLQIIFWFNPLIYLIKRDVKLNHEFLADRAVIDNGIKPAAYQTILLAFSSNAQHQELANAINYSSIKKRFTVMNTHTSKRSIWMRSVLLLPLLAILLYGFTEREQVIREITPTKVIELYLNEDGILLQQNEAVTFKDIEALYREDSKLQVSVNIFPDADVTIGKDITSKLRAIGIKNITVCTSRVAEFQGKRQDPITPKQLAEYNKLAKYYNTQNSTNQIVKQKDAERLEYLYKLMSDTENVSAAPFPALAPAPPKPPLQQPSNYATEFVKGAKNNGKKAIVIEIITNRVLLNGKISSLATFNEDVDALTKDWKTKDYNASMPSFLFKNPNETFLNKLNIEFLKTVYSKVQGGMDLLIPAPPATTTIPTPPSPTSTINHLKSMNELRGVFYYENKKISYQKAVQLVQKTKTLQVQTKHPFAKSPATYISKNPIAMDIQEKHKKPATKKEIKIYNTLANKYNKNRNGKILKTEISSMYDIYNRMTDTQRKNAQPYPATPPPPIPPKAPKAPVKVIKSKLTWLLLNKQGQLLLNDKLGTLTFIEAEFKRIQNNKSVSKNIVFKHDKDAPKAIINKVNEFINTYNLVNINDTLPPPPPIAPKVKKGESSKIPPPPAPPTKQ